MCDGRESHHATLPNAARGQNVHRHRRGVSVSPRSRVRAAQSHIPSHAHAPKRPEVSERREPIGSTHREDERQLGARGERVLRLDYLKQPLLGDAASLRDHFQLQAL